MLTPQILKTQRAGFFEYIKKVETKGPAVLDPLMQQGRRKPCPNSAGETIEDTTGWPAAKDCLDAYLRVANLVIEDCRSVQSFDDFDSKGRRRTSYDSNRRESRGGRKADSGVSFSSNHQSKRRPSTSSSAGKDKSNPPTPSSYQAQFPAAAKQTGGTALEKIAREIKKIRTKRSQILESRSRPTTPALFERQGRDRSRVQSDGSEQTLVEEPPRPQSRAGSFVRSISRMRSRSRPSTPAPAEPIPPTPTVPANFMDYDDDDDDQDNRSKLRRSFSIGRARSSTRNGKTLKKSKSMTDTKAATGDRGRASERKFGSADEAFDEVEMRRQREQWEMKEQARSGVFVEDGHEFIVGEAV